LVASNASCRTGWPPMWHPGRATAATSRRLQGTLRVVISATNPRAFGTFCWATTRFTSWRGAGPVAGYRARTVDIDVANTGRACRRARRGGSRNVIPDAASVRSTTLCPDRSPAWHWNTSAVLTGSAGDRATDRGGRLPGCPAPQGLVEAAGGRLGRNTAGRTCPVSRSGHTGGHLGRDPTCAHRDERVPVATSPSGTDAARYLSR